MPPKPNEGAAPVDEDPIQRAMGSMGKYQILMCILVFMTKFPVAFHQMSIIFFTPPVSYTCKDEGSGDALNVCPCKNPEYDKSVFTNTITMSWHLICERKHLASLTQTFFMGGMLIGSIIFGALADRFGRRIPLVVAVILQLVSGVGASMAPEYWSFTMLRAILGAATSATMVVGYVIVVECIGKEYRQTMSALYQLPLNIGHLMLPGFGYLFRSWTTFQLALALPSVVLLSYICFLDESPRWLLATGQTEKAIPIIMKAAKMNKLPTETIEADINKYQSSKSAAQNKKGTLLDLFKTPNLCKNTICMSFNWMVCGLGFYGVAQYIGKIGGNIFLNVAICAACTIPGTLLSIPLMKCMGRKPLVISTLLITAFSMFAIAVIPDSIPFGQVALACIAAVGFFIVFIVIYLYASEIFPTVVRNAGIGLVSMLCRVGSMAAPFVADMGIYEHWIPPLIFGILPLIAAALCLLMPETKGVQLVNTIEEGEALGKKAT